MKRVRSELTFDNYLTDFIVKNNKPYKLIEKNSGKSIVWDEEKQFGINYRKHLNPEQMSQLWIFAVVKQNVQKMIKIRTQKPLPISYNKSKKNVKIFDKMKDGEKFLASDMNHAYWRIAYNENYIDRKTYSRFLPKEFKPVRNKSLSCLISKTVSKTYNEKNELINIEYDGSQELNDAYQDIRNKTYKILHDCSELIGNGFLKYATDCIYYKSEYKELVEKHLKECKMQFKTIECFKLDNEYFVEGSTDKKF